jgi:hypothetical protein
MALQTERFSSQARAHKLSDDRQKSLETIEKKVEGIQEDFEHLDLGDPEQSESRTHLLPCSYCLTVFSVPFLPKPQKRQ